VWCTYLGVGRVWQGLAGFELSSFQGSLGCADLLARLVSTCYFGVTGGRACM
jgi:hypothetical protein